MGGSWGEGGDIRRPYGCCAPDRALPGPGERSYTPAAMTLPTRVSTAWIRPIETDPSLLVDRARELADLGQRLEDLRDAGTAKARILIQGERGVGKSIFARAALTAFKGDHPTEVAAIELEGRALQYRSLLEALARNVATAGRDCVREDSDLRFELAELEMLGSQSEITRSATEASARRYGAEASAGLSLMAKLGAKFAWEETRSAGQTISAKATVTDSILHAGICAVLESLANAGVTVVILFDDLDQAGVHGDMKEALELWKKVLSIDPCIALVHLRSEMLVDDVRREIDHQIAVPKLSAPDLQSALVRRLEGTPSGKEPAGVRDALTAWGAPLARLAGLQLTPLVYLRWAKALLDTHGPTPPPDWNSEAQLLRASPLHADVEPALLKKLLEVVDACAVVDRRYCRPADLRRGRPTTAVAGPAGLTEEELEYCIQRAELLIPRNRFEPDPVYRVDPVLDVLRPTVLARLA